MPAWPIGERQSDGRLLVASAERNKGPILDVLRRILPPAGLVLEIGSGTGQHVAHFAKSLPHLQWQPSDATDAFGDSVRRWIDAERLTNVRTPLTLDVTARPWPLREADAIVCINVIHVSPWSTTEALFDGASEVLRDHGILLLYGPYRRDGRHTAASNEAFDASLRAHDARWGVRDLADVGTAARLRGFDDGEAVEMPANNLCVVFRRSAGVQ